MIWFTADTHFAHANIIDYCNRPFGNVDEMDSTIIRNWNSQISPTDIVFHLGDFAFKYPEFYANHLNGLIRLVPGTHDKKINQKQVSTEDPLIALKPTYIRSFSGVEIDAPIILCHYALRVWEKSHFNSYHLYGHSHGRLPGIGRSMDVGVDTNNFKPYSVLDILRLLEGNDNPNLIKEKRK